MLMNMFHTDKQKLQ